MKRLFSIVAAVAVACTLAVFAPGAATADPYCGITWGSGVKSAGLNAAGWLRDVRGGRHECYDRLVIDLDAPGGHGYHVSYVNEITQDGSGAVIPTRGAAKLQIVARGRAYDDNGQSTYHPANWTELVDVTGWSTFRQVVFAGTFEGDSTVGIGLRARLPFRAFTLPRDNGGTRIVIDVAHFW
ncbi:hypothetical protein JOD54_000315 [Actinokineospora baliensis]|uniref:AMIN-like domain-containing (lipo)protein n=1 Tax=Actinokineospora baliensis TaxID=547056 RepID=UPI0027DD0906|nr:hypothetical protein [Actinokineospora baliensis]MBM7770111.1 hypothetical protein [Actinokineospora baliensis]